MNQGLVVVGNVHLCLSCAKPLRSGLILPSGRCIPSLDI